MRHFASAVLILLFGFPAGAAGAAGKVQGYPAEGRAIAERWCAACHQVSEDQAVISTDVPAFATIADKYPGDTGLAVLEGFLADPHPVMRDMSLTRREIRDLVAYIGSLQTTR